MFVYFLMCSFINERKLILNCKFLFVVGLILDLSQLASAEDPISRDYMVPQVFLVVKIE